MKRTTNGIIFSPSDLANHISCRHLTNLNKKAAMGLIKKPTYTNRVVDMLRERGLKFEAEYLTQLELAGKTIVKISQENENAAQDTIDAMKAGVDVIYQARLVQEGEWEGWADFILKVNSPSKLGNWSYEVLDTKLATETRAGTILQIALYSEKIGTIQGVMPENMRVQNPDGEAIYRVDDYIAYVRLAKLRLVQAINNDMGTYPEPIVHCDICRWWEVCNQKRREDDHLGFIAGMGTSQIKEVRTHNVNTLEEMSELALPIPFVPNKGSVETYTKLREQARVQNIGRVTKRPIHETLDVEPEKGFNKLPEPNKFDIYLDLEGDPMVEPGGLEYLFGWFCEDVYHHIWVKNEEEEKAAFEAFIAFVFLKLAKEPNLHIYHYAPYETTAFKRIMGKYATCEEQIDTLLRAGKFVDLYGVVRQSIRASVEKYSIKDLEQFYGYVREMDLRTLSKLKATYEFLLETNKLEEATEEMVNSVQLYNQDDCISTQKLHEWLEGIRTSLIDSGVLISRPEIRDGAASEKITAHLEKIKPIYDALMLGVSENKSERDRNAQAKYILAHMLNWYRSEEKSYWWTFHELTDLDEDDALDRVEALSKLEHKPLHRETIDDVVYDTYSFPYQETDIKVGDDVKIKSINRNGKKDAKKIGEVIEINSSSNQIKIKKIRACNEIHPSIIFVLEDHISTVNKEASIIHLAESIIENGFDGVDNRCGIDLLFATNPRTTSGVDLTQESLQKTIDWALKLDNSILPIQGPPGAGKSYTASHLILELVKNKKKIGISAMSNKVITNLVHKVNNLANTENFDIRIVQKVSKYFDEVVPWNTHESKDDVINMIDEVDIIAGTPYLWCLPNFKDSVDYLIVDEAGQLSLIDTLSISPAASNLILLGDPQQLKQPQKGVHPEGTELSALEHILGENKTIKEDQGVFLAHTWRMHPSICSFDSELFYESKLESIDNLINQKVNGETSYNGSGLFLTEVEHQGNTSSSDEEVAKIAEIVDQLTSGNVCWIDAEKVERKLTKSDIKIISPYNLQVQKLKTKIPNVEIGTVDKFQGQEAPVVIYSVATSSPADAPRGMDFLYSPNRFNVAVSRARAIFIMVANSSIFEPDCKSPVQIKLANPFCRFAELAKKIN